MRSPITPDDRFFQSPLPDRSRSTRGPGLYRQGLHVTFRSPVRAIPAHSPPRPGSVVTITPPRSILKPSVAMNAFGMPPHGAVRGGAPAYPGAVLPDALNMFGMPVHGAVPGGAASISGTAPSNGATAGQVLHASPKAAPVRRAIAFDFSLRKAPLEAIDLTSSSSSSSTSESSSAGSGSSS